MGLAKKHVEKQIAQAESQLAAAESKYKDKVQGKFKKHPVWRAYAANLKTLKKKLSAIQKLEERDSGLRKDH